MEKAGRIKNLLDLISCMLCSISIALIIDCFAFFGYFASAVIPISFVICLSLLSAATIAARAAYVYVYQLKKLKNIDIS